MEQLPNYKSARLLGICLNVMGFRVGDHKGYGREEYPLRRAVLAWTKKHYMNIRTELPDVADAVLMGSITFDETEGQLVKTYTKGLNREAPKDILELERL